MPYIRFAFLTGVTKFGQLSVFSGMNNPDDISMDSHYADLCGISEEELHTYFDADIKNLAENNGLTCEAASPEAERQVRRLSLHQ